MGKNVLFTTIIVFLVVADVSDAAFLWKFRKLVASPPNDDPNKPGSPIPSPVLPGKQSSSVGGEEKGKEKKQIGPPPATTAGKDVSKDKQVTNDTHTTPVTPPTDVKEHNNTHKEPVKDKEKEEEKKEEEKEKEEEKGEEKKEEKEEQKEKGEEKKEEEEQKEKGANKPIVPVGSEESCDEIGRRCQDLKSMTACIKNFDHDSKALVLLIQNKGNSNLKVDVTALSSGGKQKVINVPKLQNKQVKMSLVDSGINEITLNAGNGRCVLHLGAPASPKNFFRLIPSYSKFMTPIYGAYLMLVITLIAGGVFGCCWFSKRKGHRDIPYQELEMSIPESAVAAETAEGWDEVWDDDWDEENAVRSPGGHRISANGLTSRNLKKDDWEDWDD